MGLSDIGITPVCVETQQGRKVSSSLRDSQYRRIIDRLRAARIELGLTQAELARRLNRPQSFIAKIERCERRLDVIEFLNVAKSLNTDPLPMIEDIFEELPLRGNGT